MGCSEISSILRLSILLPGGDRIGRWCWSAGETFDTVVLPQRHNLHYLGERTYDEIPGYLRGFDVCLIPYRTASGIYANPVKFREYQAAGKPIVATLLPEVLQFGELVRITVTGDEFVDRIEQCLSEDPSFAERRIASMRGQAWPSRAAELAHIL
jgi:glycosyltransferase involved in cell wall biosynthesis